MCKKYKKRKRVLGDIYKREAKDYIKDGLWYTNEGSDTRSVKINQMEMTF